MGKFTLKQGKSGFSFNLTAKNNEIIATSQVYTTKAACLKGIDSVKSNAPVAPVEDQTEADFQAQANPKYEVYRDRAGEYRFHLKAANGRIIAASEGYADKEECLNGLGAVKANAPAAEIV